MPAIAAALAAALAAAAHAAPAASLNSADALFAQSRYQAALPIYENLSKNGSDEERLRARFRAVECEALLFRYLQAAQRAQALPLPKDPAWRGRLLLLRAEAEREAALQYGWAAPADEEEGSSDPARRTRAQWRALAGASFAALYPLRQALARRPLSAETYFVDTKGSDLAETPTLWDFAVERWTDFLLQQDRGATPAAAPKPEALSFAARDYAVRWAPSEPAVVQAAALMEEAARLDGRGRALVRELWKLRRAELPAAHPDLVAPAPDGKLDGALLSLRLWWLDHLTQPAARSRAGLAAAQQLESSGKRARAVEVCKSLERRWPAERATVQCRLLRARIEQPSLGLEGAPAPPGGKGALRVSARNLDTAALRLYKTTPEELAALRPGSADGWDALRGLSAAAVAAFSAREPDQAWTVAVKSTEPYAAVERAADPPRPLPPGLWVALASSDAAFAPGKSQLSAVILNVTDLVLFQTAGPSGKESDFVFDPNGPTQREAPAFHYYAADGRTGAPVEADIAAYFRENAPARRVDLRAGADGTAELPARFSLEWGRELGASADALARRGASLAYAQNALWTSHGVPAPVRLMVDLDRPIYRPGQTVRGKVTVLRRLPLGFAAYDGRARVELTVRDSHYTLVSSATLTLDDYGSAEFTAALPPGRLLGRWQAEASLSDFGRAFSGSQGFSVEEYKRPEFEVTLSSSAGPFRYGRPARVSGDAKYYFGGAVPNAPVSWRVVRRSWLPWFCWWWRPLGGEQEVASGTATADASGRFAFSFTPRPADQEGADKRPAEFVVTVDARDAGGRTIQATQSYRAGPQAYLFAVEPPAGFLSAGRAATVAVRLMTLDERPAEGRGRFELRRVTGAPRRDEQRRGWSGDLLQEPSLEDLFRDSADGPVAASGPLDFAAGGAAAAKLPALPEGVYRLSVSADDPWGGLSEQKVVLLSVSAHPSARALPLPSVTLPEHASYLPGETARLLVGSDELDGGWLEVWGGGTLLERRRLDAGLRLVSVRVGDEHRGGFSVRWFGAKDYRARGGQASAAVPWADKRLSLTLDAPAAVEPGAKVAWPLTVTDSRGRPVDAQALVRVFDRSLEYYVRQAGFDWVSHLYDSSEGPGAALSSRFSPWAMQLPRDVNELSDMMRRFSDKLAEPRPPRLRLNEGRVYGFGGIFPAPAMAAARGGADLAMAESRNGPAAMAARAEGGATAKKAPVPSEAQAPAVRSDFSETAYFAPRLSVRHGRAQVSFTMPQRLTGWKAQAVALTKNAEGGAVEAVVVTRKELMVRVQLPRFVRENDEARLKALVDNGTDRPLSGEVTLSVTRDSAPAEAQLGLTGLEKPFSVAAHGQAALSWALRAPRGTGTFQVTAVARSGALEDAERRELPLLPSRQRLVESVLAALDGTARKTLRLPAFFAKGPTRENESMTLQLDPQLALSIMNSLPFLVHYPYECTEQVLDRYVPLSIVEAFYREDPRLADAAAKLPRRKTLTPVWDREDPRRLQRLMETPWEELSKGLSAPADLVDLLNPALVERERADAQAKLLSYQNADGSFSWFPGGGGDPYMTLLVLSGWAEAHRYGVSFPVQGARRALAYVERELPSHLHAEQGELSLTLFAAHVLTSYPAELPESRTGYRMAKTFLAFADAHGDALTPLGRAYAALAYRALGDSAKSGNYLDRALDGARRDPLSGVYWQPEKLSWLWYNDTVETHAFLLKTLQELRPRDPLIPGMVQWLLLNRVGNEWKSTRASAEAIYALLDVLRARGALERGDAFSVVWGTQTVRARVAPLDWLAKPLRFSREDGGIGPEDGQARVDKKGPGFAFASLTWVYSTDAPVKASGPGLTSVSRRYFKRVKAATGWTLKPLSSGDAVAVGDELEVHLSVSSRAPLEYVQLKEPRPAGVEAETLTSGWRWDLLPRYEEPRDSLTNFFMSRLPHGEYVLKYRARATTPGRYRVGAAVLQSMYAPEIASHSGDFVLEVR